VKKIHSCLNGRHRDINIYNHHIQALYKGHYFKTCRTDHWILLYSVQGDLAWRPPADNGQAPNKLWGRGKGRGGWLRKIGGFQYISLLLSFFSIVFSFLKLLIFFFVFFPMKKSLHSSNICVFSMSWIEKIRVEMWAWIAHWTLNVFTTYHYNILFLTNNVNIFQIILH